MTGTGGRPHFSARTKARKAALDVLFEADLRGEPALAILHDHVLLADPPLREYTAELVEGVMANLRSIDARLSQALDEGWSLPRMPRVDRALARIAVYEIDHGGIDHRVAIAEALVLAGELSTDESPSFLNGVLSGVVRAPMMDEDQVAQVHAEVVAEAEHTGEPTTDELE
ncbi:transcription antitermination factor NusB [Aestuariimicrobium sp. T2.26MG-19.2B]|uniref:transcription antitermination factor NusB n=1 Tax=Aestuariimicrobium sp. T2.26MG-19.2B TaxID=3040679 RepID=UPI0024773F5C|nr:transcription antitermination factor NusB [Aestuariimicrobium sp. T2.26MG-19.2B]CAI9409958.1 Transcription antitermination protein NusB [Aestuariimicrobium sp. T2.26MG-19.2B]